jgi:hypothetical protein
MTKAKPQDGHPAEFAFCFKGHRHIFCAHRKAPTLPSPGVPGEGEKGQRKKYGSTLQISGIIYK